MTTKVARKQEKLKKRARLKSWHNCTKTWHDLARQNALFSTFKKRVTMAKTWHDLVKP